MKSHHYFGITRFSVFIPKSKAWILSRDSEEREYQNRLFSDERLSARFDIFFNKAMPIYQEMSIKYNYRHIVQYSNNLPKKWKKELTRYSEKFPVIYLQEVNESTGTGVVILDILKDSDSCGVTTFRVDDDDLLSLDYLDLLSAYSENPSYEGMAVSFGRGVFSIYQNGKMTKLKDIRHPLLGLGQAYIGRYDSASKKVTLPRTTSHAKTDTLTPTILDSRTPCYIWTHHLNQDTRTHADQEKAMEKLNRKHLGLPDLPEDFDLLGKFPTLSGDMSR